MSRTVALALTLTLVAALLGVAPGEASKKLASETSLSCTSCHDKPGSRLLTDAGKYFEFNRSMDGFEPLKENFGKCTMCHVRKPGSTKLTARGLEFAKLVKDMAGLKEWLKQNHPAVPAKQPK